MSELYSFIDYLGEKYGIDNADLNQLDIHIQAVCGEPAETVELDFSNDEANYGNRTKDED